MPNELTPEQRRWLGRHMPTAIRIIDEQAAALAESDALKDQLTEARVAHKQTCYDRHLEQGRADRAEAQLAEARAERDAIDQRAAACIRELSDLRDGLEARLAEAGSMREAAERDRDECKRVWTLDMKAQLAEAQQYIRTQDAVMRVRVTELEQYNATKLAEARALLDECTNALVPNWPAIQRGRDWLDANPESPRAAAVKP